MQAYRSSRLAAWFAPKQVSRIAVAEVIGFMLLLMLFCVLAEPDDPFLLNRPFSWLWLAPVILALRYGTLAAFGAVALLVLMWFLLPIFGVGGGAFPASFFLGGLILTLIAGEFSDVWSTRLRRVAEVNAYLNERLDSLTRRHYLLRLSHERLEQELLVKPMTLRDALMRLRRLVAEETGGSAMPHAQEFLHLLSQSCQLEVACLHLLENGKPVATPVASIGEASEFEPRDLLVQYALENNALAHVQTEGLQSENSRYLVVAPLNDSAGQAIGLLVVERLPFLSLNEETLRFLAVLLGYYADSVRLGPTARDIIQAVPTCPAAFASEIMRLHRIREQVGIHSTLAVLVVQPGLRQSDIVLETLRQARQLDITWEFPENGRRYILTLMPLQGEAALSGYLLRTERWLREVFGLKDFVEAGVVPHSTPIGALPPAELLVDLLKRCRHDGQ